MRDSRCISSNRDILLENFAAELTCAVFPIALRHGMMGSWIKVELGLWRALAETVRKWARVRPPRASSDEFRVWWESLLADLTENAFGVAVKHGIKGSLLEVELGLYRAFHLVIRRLRHPATPAVILPKSGQIH
jgi:hypothetical protein